MALAMLLISSTASADPLLDIGNKAYDRGDVMAAVDMWQRSASPEAWYWVGKVATSGKIKLCDPINCAADWFYKSGDAGYLPALNELAALYINNGRMETGVDVLKVGARWNDPDARRILEEMGRAVPPPDLAEQAAARQSQERAQADAQQRAATQAQARQEWTEKFLYGMTLGAALNPPRPRVTNNYYSTAPASVPTSIPPRQRDLRCKQDPLSLSIDGKPEMICTER
jgi:hypothetical protein